MFNILSIILLAIIVICAFCTPLLCLNKSNSYKYFSFIWILLYIAQLYMYVPGSDVSPYAYSISAIKAVRFYGLTISAYASLLLLFYVGLSVAFRKKLLIGDCARPFVLALIPNVVVFFWTSSLGSSIDSFAKMMAPFAVMLFLITTVDASHIYSIKKVVELINVLMVGQVIICKIAYGLTSAYNYYYELEEEFFGYYNHPHSFTSLLWILSLYNVYEISRKEHTQLNLILLVTNIVFIYFTGVRTYLVALCAGLAYIGVASFADKHGKNIRGFVILIAGLLLIYGSRIIENFGAGRTYIATDASSGRFFRWIIDLTYFTNQYSFLEIFFGRGVDAVYSVNKELIGVYINSLNLFVDLLLNFGLIGCTLIVVGYFLLFKQCINKNNKLYMIGVFISFIVASMINSPISYVPTMTMLVVVIWIMKEDEEKILSPRKHKLTFKIRRIVV